MKAGVLGFAAMLLAARALPAAACAVMEEDLRPGDSVVVTEESAVIIWDEKNKREHFIRSADFQGGAKDIGFIVPSPSTPELKAANKAAFSALKKVTAPGIEYRTNYRYRWFAFFDNDTDESRGPLIGSGADVASDDITSVRTSRPKVEVLQKQTVAGYNATTLKASDAAALNRWLNKNGYLAKADFREWLEPYVQNGWVVTAFKVRNEDKNQKRLSLNPVRMSFKTDKPFYPYREPAGAREGRAKTTPRTLRVYVIGSERMNGAIGDREKRAWPGQTKWSDDLEAHLNSAERGNLAKQLAIKPEQFPEQMHLTSFEDASSPRPGFDEVYFTPASEKQKLLPKPIIKEEKRSILIPLDLLFIGGLALFVVGRGVRRRRQ